MNFHDIQQNSDEWFELRVGKVTSSKVATIMAHFGKDFGEPAIRYAKEIALERVTGIRIEKDNYQSYEMRRGNELEPFARELYEFENMVVVKNGGFFEDGKRGDSPDGLVGDEGVIEIKSVQYNAHWYILEKGGYDTKYKWQIQNHLWITGRKWCDFVSYCPEFPPDKKLYIFRIEKNNEMIVQMEERIKQFEELVEKNIEYLK